MEYISRFSDPRVVIPCLLGLIVLTWLARACVRVLSLFGLLNI